MGSARLCVVGAGRVGTALAAALRAVGSDVEHLAARRLPAELDDAVYVLCARDPQLRGLAREILARHRGDPPVLLHTAGAVPSAMLRDAGAVAAAVMHPLVAFAGDRAPALAGAVFALEGDAAALEVARAIVERLGARALVLAPEQLARWHAAAVLASNHVLALVDLGRGLLADLGVAEEVAQAGLAALFASVGDNLVAVGLPRALTGPISRGDHATVARHLAALRENPAARAVYLATAPRLVAIARAQGIAASEDLARIEALLYPPADLD